MPPVASCARFKLRLAVLLLSASLSTTGCIVFPLIPPIPEYAPQPLEDLVTGASTRADVLMRFGCPDERWDDDRYFVYGWNESHAGLIVAFIFVVPFSGGGAGAVGAAPLQDRHRLMIEFAPDGRVVRYAEVSAFTSRRVDKKVWTWIERADEEAQ